MIVRKAILLIAGVIILAVGVTAQVPSPSLPQVVPPPADAAALGRYSDVPVNLSVGLPTISVPIYEIKTPRLSLPISLNYYASGIKVDDIASWVGLGWSLDAGGAITRTIKDIDDFRQKGFYNVTVPQADTLSQAVDWQYLDNVSNGLIDGEPDNFFYNFAGHTGKFVFAENKQPLSINYQEPVKIQYDGDSSFTIYSGNGDQYLFASREHTERFNTSMAYSGTPVPDHDESYYSSWYLSRIISFDHSDTILFSYYTDNELLQNFNNYSIILGTSFNVKTNGITSQSHIYSNPLRLQNIVFRNGKVNFYSSQNRSDVIEAKLDSIIVSRWDAPLQVYHPVRIIRFSYDYYLSNFTGLGTGSRLRLDSVQTVGVSGEYGGSYSFAYDSTMLPLSNSTGRDLFNYYNGQIDNTTLIPSQALGTDTTLYNLKGADRNTYLNYLQAGVLKKLTYPTGGFATFDYEPNNYATNQYGTVPEMMSANATGTIHDTVITTFVAGVSTQATVNVVISKYTGYTPSVQTRPGVSFIDLTTNPSGGALTTGDPNNGLNSQTVVGIIQGHTYQLTAEAFDNDHVFAQISVTWAQPDTSLVSLNGGGLRSKKIAHFDMSGRFVKSEIYKYGYAESGIGYIPTSTTALNTFNANRYFYTGTLQQDGTGCLATVEQDQVFSGSSIYDAFNLSSAPVSYPEVARYLLDSLGNSAGKTVYDYSVYHNSLIPASQSYFEGLTVENSGWQGGMLLMQSDFVFKNGGYSIVKREIDTHDSLTGPSSRGLKANYQQSISGCYTLGALGEQYYWFDYPIPTGTVLPSSKTVYTYDQNDTTKFLAEQQTMQYYYAENLQPSVITRNMSDGTIETITNRFPEDVDSISGLTTAEIAAIDSLETAHNVTCVLQTQLIKENRPSDLIRNDYQILSPQLLVPLDIQQQVQQFPMTNRIQFNAYDSRGSILQDSKDFGVQHSYIWDYNGAYPIAEAVNAAQTDMAYTSFESDGTGNWVPANGTIDPTVSITGRSSFHLNGGTISKSGLNSSTTYIVSYWSQNGSYSIPGTISGYPTTGKTVSFNNSGWTLYVHKVTGQSTITLSGTGHIDELRLYPTTAQMTTYTYDPLVGMTNQTDAGNRVTYYEYDGLQRLKRIRDQDYNILKTFDYQFQASTGCGGNCFSITMQTLTGTNTLSYPVGVFNIHGKLLGNAATPVAYTNLWNSDTADTRLGSLVAGTDSLHFKITLNAGQTLPASVTGCRYYQVDLRWNVLDGVRNINAAYVDFGDGTSMRLGRSPLDTTNLTLAPNTVLHYNTGTAISDANFYIQYGPYYVHTYPDTSLKTITFYHNDSTETPAFDSWSYSSGSLSRLTNFQGYFPQHMTFLGGTSYQQSGASSVANVRNWSTIRSITEWYPYGGYYAQYLDPWRHMGYAQDFLAADTNLATIRTANGSYYTQGYSDTTFKISRIKSNWTTYFTKLNAIAICEDQWSHEDLSVIPNLVYFNLIATNQNHSNNPGGNSVVYIAPSEIDTIFNQIDAGAGQHISGGTIIIQSGSTWHTTASTSAVAHLLSKNWTLTINSTTVTN